VSTLRSKADNGRRAVPNGKIIVSVVTVLSSHTNRGFARRVNRLI